jgi:hypothetical protein
MSLVGVVLVAALMSAAPGVTSAGGENPALEDEPHSGDSDSSEDGDEIPLTPLEVPPAPPRPPPPDIRTNPAYWSKGGWRELRWGMGPADAFSRMGSAVYANWIPWAAKAADPIAGRMFFRFRDPKLNEVNDLLELRFGERGLTAVTLQRDGDAAVQTERFAEATPHFESVLKKLSLKHGKPRCSEFVDGRTCEWRAESVRIQLRLAATYANLAEDERFTGVFLEYADPAEPSGDAARVAKKEVSVRTHPRTWSDLRLKQIRLGMGTGDVIDRILGRRVWNRLVDGQVARCAFACKRRNDTSVYCEVKEECAALDADAGGVNVRTLTFNAAGRLRSAEFAMEGRDRSKLERELHDLTRDLMRQISPSAVRAQKQDSVFAEDEVSHVSAYILPARFGAHTLVIQLSTKKYDRAPDRKSPRPKRHSPPVKEI